MKICKVEVFPLSYGTDDFPPRRRYFVVLKLTTDEGIVGWGEASDCYGHSSPMTVKALIEEKLQWLVLGQNPLNVERLIRRIRKRTYSPQGCREFIIQAISAIEIALWDIRGKVFGKSVSELLGSYRDELSLYSSGTPNFYDDPNKHLEFYQPLLKRGVKTVKVRTGKSLEWDMQFVRLMRKLLPKDIQIAVDGKHNYKTESAIKLSKVLGEIDALWFEEPIPDTNLDELAWLARESPVPLAYGEHSYTLNDFRDIIKYKAARILEPDATVCGGISEARNVAILADAYGLPVVPHSGGLTAIGLAANVHVASAIPNFVLFEMDGREKQPLVDELLVEPILSIENIVQGCIPVPSGPGLGIDINEEIFEKYPYQLDEQIARSFPRYGTQHI